MLLSKKRSQLIFDPIQKKFSLVYLSIEVKDLLPFLFISLNRWIIICCFLKIIESKFYQRSIFIK